MLLPSYKPTALNLPDHPCWVFAAKHGENSMKLYYFSPLKRQFCLSLTDEWHDFWEFSHVAEVDPTSPAVEFGVVKELGHGGIPIPSISINMSYWPPVCIGLPPDIFFAQVF